MPGSPHTRFLSCALSYIDVLCEFFILTLHCCVIKFNKSTFKYFAEQRECSINLLKVNLWNLICGNGVQNGILRRYIMSMPLNPGENGGCTVPTDSRKVFLDSGLLYKLEMTKNILK